MRLLVQYPGGASLLCGLPPLPQRVQLCGALTLATRGVLQQSRVLMKALNLSGSGQISLWEFCAACLRRPQYLAEPLLYDAFGMLDADSTGYIYPHNLEEVVGLTEADAHLTVLEADADEVRKRVVVLVLAAACASRCVL